MKMQFKVETLAESAARIAWQKALIFCREFKYSSLDKNKLDEELLRDFLSLFKSFEPLLQEQNNHLLEMWQEHQRICNKMIILPKEFTEKFKV